MWRCNEWTRQVLYLAGSQGTLVIGKWQSCSLSMGWVWYLGWEQKWKVGEEVWDAAESWRQEAGGVCGVLCASTQRQGDVSSSISVVTDWCRLVLKKQLWVSAKYLLGVTFARAIHSQYKISALESNWGGFCEGWFDLQGAQGHTLIWAWGPGDHSAGLTGPLSKGLPALRAVWVQSWH